jgi:hypothetical protein
VQERGELTVKIMYKPAKETSDKEALIDAVLAEIQRRNNPKISCAHQGTHR